LIEKMSKILLEKEYLTRDEFKDLMDNGWVMKEKEKEKEKWESKVNKWKAKKEE
jgi:hypothetical protein